MIAEINIEVDRELYTEAKQVLESFGLNIEEVTAQYFEHIASNKERIMEDFRSGVSAEELVEREADEVLKKMLNNRI